jgi:tetratricopeptide (TPR) repeat protein
MMVLPCLGLALAATCLHANDLPADMLNAELAVKHAEEARLEKAIATDPANQALRFRLGAVLCDLGAAGEASAIDEALKVFAALRKEAPHDAEFLAFYGNACTIEAKYSFVLTKLSWAHDGFNYLDTAVKDAPDNVTVRVIRALNSAQVPGFLGREQTAREDFAWIMDRLNTHPQDFSPELLRSIYYYAGEFALAHDEPKAVQLLTQAAAIPASQDDVLAPKIDAFLKTARAKFPAAALAKST